MTHDVYNWLNLQAGRVRLIPSFTPLNPYIMYLTPTFSSTTLMSYS